MIVEQWGSHGPVRRELKDTPIGPKVVPTGPYGWRAVCACGRVLCTVEGSTVGAWQRRARLGWRMECPDCLTAGSITEIPNADEIAVVVERVAPDRLAMHEGKAVEWAPSSVPGMVRIVYPGPDREVPAADLTPSYPPANLPHTESLP